VSRSNEENEMSKMMQQPDGTWQTTRKINNRETTIYIRDIGHGFFSALIFGRDGIELADAMAESKKEAIAKAVRIAKRKTVSQRNLAAALQPCGK
jgi:hypothetical protein